MAKHWPETWASHQGPASRTPPRRHAGLARHGWGAAAHGLLVAAPLLLAALGLLDRVIVARGLGPHGDETDSLLAIQGVAAHGWPIFPSGVLYVHGATLSYVLAPLVWLGWGDIGHLAVLRAASAVFAALAISLTFWLGQRSSGAALAGLLAAVLVAFDPLGVQWGSMLRMYGLGQALVLGVVLLFLRALAPEDEENPPVRRRTHLGLAGLVVTFWLATFTHLAVAFLLPALVAAALLRGRDLLGSQRGLAAAVVLCVPAPLAVVAASTLWGATGTAPPSGGDAGQRASFVGDQHLAIGVFPRLDLTVWSEQFAAGSMGDVMAALILALSGVVALFVLFGRWPSVAARRATAAMLFLYWIPVLGFAATATGAHARYLLFFQPLGAVLVALALFLVWRGLPSVPARVAVVGATAILIANLGVGLRADDWTDGPNREALGGLRYVADHREPGDLVLYRWPPLAYLVVGERRDIRFLVDREWMAGRYARPGPAGSLVDMWLGNPAAASTADQCAILAANPGTWVVGRVNDNGRVSPPNGLEWAANGTAIALVQRTAEGVPVYRSVPASAWQPPALRRCSLPR